MVFGFLGLRSFLILLGLSTALVPFAIMAHSGDSPLSLRMSRQLDAVLFICDDDSCSKPLQQNALANVSNDAEINKLSLAQAYSYALSANSNLKAANAQLNSSAEQLEQVKSQLKPRVYFSANHAYNIVSQSAIVGAASETQYASNNFNVAMRVPIYRPALTNEIDASAAKVRDAEAQRNGEQNAVAIRVVEAYLQILSSEGKLHLLSQQMQLAQMNIKSAQMRLNAGVGIRTDIDEWRTKADILSAQRLEADQGRQGALLLLTSLTQKPVTGVHSMDVASFESSIFPAHNAIHWMDKASLRSAELQSMRARVDAARAAIDRAKNGHLPTLEGQLQIGRSRGENTTLPTNAVFNRQIGIQLDIPLYSGGALQSIERQAVAEHERAQSLLESARQDLYARIQREWRSVTESSARIAALDQALLSATQLVVSARRSLAAGMRTAMDVLSANEQLYQVRHERFQSQLILAGARLKLLALAGELNEVEIANAQTWFSVDSSN